MKSYLLYTVLFATSVAFMSSGTGCATHEVDLPKPESVDLERFMGTWFVLGYTPIIVDGKAHNAVEHYYLAENGDIQTTYQFRDGAFDGKLKTFTPRGRVQEEGNNAEWKMQFIWPFAADYVILHVDESYTETVVVHPNRKYAWLMTRSPEISEEAYAALLGHLEAAGFDPAIVQRLPQDWSSEPERLQAVIDLGATGPLAPR